MVFVYVAICLLATPAKDCNELTAKSWHAGEGPQDSRAACVMHAMMLASDRRLVDADTYIKIFCKHSAPMAEDYVG